MYAGDETNHGNDAGPCPDCGHHDCWLGCEPHPDPATTDEVER